MKFKSKYSNCNTRNCNWKGHQQWENRFRTVLICCFTCWYYHFALTVEPYVPWHHNMQTSIDTLTCMVNGVVDLSHIFFNSPVRPKLSSEPMLNYRQWNQWENFKEISIKIQPFLWTCIWNSFAKCCSFSRVSLCECCPVFAQMAFEAS